MAAGAVSAVGNVPIGGRAVVVRIGDDQGQVKGLMERGLAGRNLLDRQSEKKGQD
ncbi:MULTISPECIES: hypothetical protein [Methylobacterium]|jgi:hypothetical protein|uniref:Uncharacterized protein n=1 Tax=Methylobacterium isbiliense TaxID=315478 RepID=A0ABQ4S6Y7_9HYPH|nr:MULTISPECIES: hypothetical protein [Methylobacterium]MBY0297652.1 hypothetical protein [Methylobacterium sp.]MDN3625752.1 hypothetical protein [Methylobacterium isbiliense]GJD98731.1 hypothetical protein GMJLKIPL_0642 [Methylobacterium isbiliense]